MTPPTRKRIDAFRTVLLRHGLPGVVLALICLWPDQPRASLQQSRELIERQPQLVAGTALVVLAVMVVTSAFGRAGLSARQWAWFGYLLLVSITEEWVFRFAGPLWLMPEIGLFPGIAVCNLLFGALHFFTLRWGVLRCLGASLGGFGLSLLVLRSGLLPAIAAHWLLTYASTPTPPGRRPDALSVSSSTA
jgi:hypothetical protein